jgi:hypothetical protein
MPNFKPKANKKIKMKKNANVTLDSKHNEKMKEFENITSEKIPKLLKRKKKLKKKLKTTTNIEDMLNIKDEIREIKIKVAKNNCFSKFIVKS